MCIYVNSGMGCRQDLHICNSQQHDTGLASAPNIYCVMIYPVRNACRARLMGCISMRVGRIQRLLSSIN